MYIELNAEKYFLNNNDAKIMNTLTCKNIIYNWKPN